MKELAILFRVLQLLAHNGRNLTVAATLFADRAFLGELASNYGAAYDALVERLIGVEGGLDLTALQREAVAGLGRRTRKGIKSAAIARSSEPAVFRALLDAEREACTLIEELIEGARGDGGRWAQWTIHLLAGLAGESEVRQFKLERRLSL